MNIETLNPRDGDILIAYDVVDRDGTGQALNEMLRARGAPANIVVLVMPHGLRLDTVDEVTMYEQGWLPRAKFERMTKLAWDRAGNDEIAALAAPPERPSIVEVDGVELEDSFDAQAAAQREMLESAAAKGLVAATVLTGTRFACGCDMGPNQRGLRACPIHKQPVLA